MCAPRDNAHETHAASLKHPQTAAGGCLHALTCCRDTCDQCLASRCLRPFTSCLGVSRGQGLVWLGFGLASLQVPAKIVDFSAGL